MGARRAVLDPAAEPSQCGLENPCLTLLGQHQRRGIGARTLAPTPGKELEPLPCAARPELNTIAERTNIFAGARFDFVKSGRAFGLTFARARSMITIDHDLVQRPNCLRRCAAAFGVQRFDRFVNSRHAGKGSSCQLKRLPMLRSPTVLVSRQPSGRS